jgi:DNA polymerase-3 subunit delta
MLNTLEQALRQAADINAPFGCCLLYGEERYPYEFLQRGFAHLLKLGHTLEVYDAATVSLAEFLASVSAASLFAQQKIVHLKNPHIYPKKDLEKLLVWLEKQSVADSGSGIVTYLFMSSIKLDGRSILVSRLKKMTFQVVKSVKLKPFEVAGRLQKRAQAAQVAIDGRVIDSLVHLHETNLTLLEQELEKMVLYVGPGGRIDQTVVDRLGIDGGGGNVFTFGDALSEGRFVDALLILDILLRARTEALLIIAMIARQFRLLSRTASAENARSSSADLAKSLKVPPFVAKKLVRQAPRLSLPGYVEVFNILHRADIALKSSRLPKKIVLESVVLQIANLR